MLQIDTCAPSPPLPRMRRSCRWNTSRSQQMFNAILKFYFRNFITTLFHTLFFHSWPLVCISSNGVCSVGKLCIVCMHVRAFGRVLTSLLHTLYTIQCWMVYGRTSGDAKVQDSLLLALLWLYFAVFTFFNLWKRSRNWHRISTGPYRCRILIPIYCYSPIRIPLELRRTCHWFSPNSLDFLNEKKECLWTLLEEWNCGKCSGLWFNIALSICTHTGGRRQAADDSGWGWLMPHSACATSIQHGIPTRHATRHHTYTGCNCSLWVCVCIFVYLLFHFW